MSNTAKATPADVAAKTEEKTVPAQNNGSKKLAGAIQSAVAADTMIDALSKIDDRLAEGVTVKVQVDEEGNVSLEVVEDKVKGLVASAKGVFKRNKKLVLATAGLVATSVVLKLIARRQAELEADIVEESSDDVSVDA